jgi:hypothetical protein
MLRGVLWIGIDGATSLVTLLTAKMNIILFLYGKPFRYRSAAIRDSWVEDLEYALAVLSVHP